MRKHHTCTPDSSTVISIIIEIFAIHIVHLYSLKVARKWLKLQISQQQSRLPQSTLKRAIVLDDNNRHSTTIYGFSNIKQVYIYIIPSSLAGVASQIKQHIYITKTLIQYRAFEAQCVYLIQRTYPLRIKTTSCAILK